MLSIPAQLRVLSWQRYNFPSLGVAWLTAETYYTLSDEAAVTWMLNDRLVNSNWQRLSVNLCHPLQVPPAMRGFSVVLEKSGPAKDPIPGALHAGLFLTVKQLKALQAEFLFSLPSKGEGSGKEAMW